MAVPSEIPSSSSIRSSNNAILRRVTNLFTNKTTTGASSSITPKSSNWVIHIRGITTGTVKIQVSMDDTNWFDFATKTADDKVASGGEPWPYVRANCTVGTTVALFVDIAE